MQDKNDVNPELIEERVQTGLGVLYNYAGWKSYELKVKGVSLSKDELISIGYMGLHNAAEIFDSNKSSDFKIFARHQINLAVLQYQRDIDILDHRVRNDINQILTVRQNLTQSLGRIPTTKEIAEKMNQDEDDILSKLKLNAQHTDINDEYTAESYNLNDKTNTADYDIESRDMQQSLGRDMNDCMDTVLKPHQKKIIELVFFEEKSAEEIAFILRQESDTKDKTYVYNTTKNSKLKLKKCMEHKGWSITDI